MRIRQLPAAISIGACLLIAPASAQNQPLSVSELGMTRIGGIEYSSAFIAMEDASMRVQMIDATGLGTVSAVLSIASSLKNLFGSDDSNQREILKTLGELRAQHSRMIILLEQIIDILEQLDVRISHAVRNEFVLALKNRISSKTIEYYETRETLMLDPAYRKRAITLFTDQWQKLSELGREMMGYGPGVFQTVGTVFFFEADTAMRIENPRQEQITKLKTYLDYFRSVMDPSLEGSVGAARTYLRDLVARADAILIAADKAVTSASPVDRGESCKDEIVCDCGTVQICHRHYTTLQGSRTAGYALSHTNQFSRRIGQCRICPGDRHTSVADQIRAGVRGSQTMGISSFPTLPSPSGNSPEQLVDFWNRTRAVITEAEKQLRTVEQAYENANLYFAEVERRIKALEK